MSHFDFLAIESKWQAYWRDHRVAACDLSDAANKYYCLVMFPYPSGTLHVGHGRNYVLGDVVARLARMRGRRVLAPMGWDAFGLPAENAAIQAARGAGTPVHPREYTRRNIEVMRGQLQRWGLLYDWDCEVTACDPEYYRWTQWLFLQMFQQGLAYRKSGTVNWCPSCNTSLANEQVVEGNCERCNSQVEPKDLEQWYLRITRYADRLLDDLDHLEGWPERVRIMQENWIGRSEGAEIFFELPEKDQKIPCFTTRPDTIFGVTFFVLAPEHPLVAEIAAESPERDRILAFVEETRRMGIRERTHPETEKEGVPLGVSVVNPVTGEDIPLWVANYAVMDYGTGAVMGVPAHDQRDFLFAKKYGLDIKVVIQPRDGNLNARTMTEAYEENGIQAASEEFSGLPNQFATRKIVEYMERQGAGRATLGYRLRDWLISRQRYWGCPIPVVYCPSCGIVGVPEKDLPVLLPDDVEFLPSGQSPLGQVESFVQTSCPKCGGAARRETDTMDTFVDSSWYFLRYLSAKDDTRAFDAARANKWMPVDIYIGGVEHAVMHLLYARFLTKVLYDLMLVEFEEPFRVLFTQGMICRQACVCSICGKHFPAESLIRVAPPEEPEGAEPVDGCPDCNVPISYVIEKMSKSKFNVVSPDELFEKFGADTQRLYMLFLGPPELDAEWSDRGVTGAHRFLHRLWTLAYEYLARAKAAPLPIPDPAALGSSLRDIRRQVHQTIRKVTEDLESTFHFNTAISAMMEMLNSMQAATCWEEPQGDSVLREALETLVVLLHPLVPHVTEELWEALGHTPSLLDVSWPEADPEALRVEEVEIPVQIDGKMRGRIVVPVRATEDEALVIAREHEIVGAYLAEQHVDRVVYVPQRVLNLVLGEMPAAAFPEEETSTTSS